MKKQLVKAGITLLILLVITAGIAALFNGRFVDFAILVGGLATISIAFTTSYSGGASNNVDPQTMSYVAPPNNNDYDGNNSPKTSLYVAVLYTLGALVALFIT